MNNVTNTNFKLLAIFINYVYYSMVNIGWEPIPIEMKFDDMSYMVRVFILSGLDFSKSWSTVEFHSNDSEILYDRD